MKKIFVAGIISLLAYSANAASFQPKATLAPIQTQTEFVSIKSLAMVSNSPKVIKRGDRVIIIYDDGTTIVVDKDGSSTLNSLTSNLRE